MEYDKPDHPNGHPDNGKCFVFGPCQQIGTAENKEGEESKSNTKDGEYFLARISFDPIEEDERHEHPENDTGTWRHLV